MIQLGKFNRLKILELTPRGAFLEENVFLPTRDVPHGALVYDSIDVFVFSEGENLSATTAAPLARVGEFAYLRVTSISEVGAFLDWGLSKDLFLPYREQIREFRVGHSLAVYVYIDNSGRICASMRTDKFLDPSPPFYYPTQPVDLFILSQTELGFKAVINHRHVGVLYANEVFEPLAPGEQRRGYVKKVRDDGKIDLTLTPTGHRAAEDIGQRILDLLAEEGGFLEMGDKTSPDVIHRAFGVSKKKFKMAVGGLLKKRVIGFEGDGIRLL